MSATNRGSERKGYDFYATPISVVDNLLNYLDVKELQNKTVLEPSAGNGNIVKSLLGGGIRKEYITTCEIREEEKDGLNAISGEVIICDFLSDMDTSRKFDLIIGNPPYSDAINFVEKCLNMLSDNGKLIFLLRTAFLESKSRYDFWQKNPLSELYVLSKRPSFTGKGTDATSYSWFIWDKSTNSQVIKVI